MFWSICSFGYEWETTFGGIDAEAGLSVQQTSDGGYIIVGETTPYGAREQDVYLIKTDANGTEQWLYGIKQGDRNRPEWVPSFAWKRRRN